MRRTGWKVAAMLALVSVMGGVAACGDDDAGDGAVPLDQVENAYLRTYCQVAIDCEFDSFVAFFGGDVDTCLDFMETLGEGDEGIDSLIESVNAGNTVYDGALARECLDAMESLSCQEVYDNESPVLACDEIFSGLLANGTDCTLDEECEGGWCDMSVACPGACADTVLIGADCSAGEKCEVGAQCEGGQCILDPGPLQLGDDCTETYRDCGFELWCDWSGNGVCENRAALGASCDDEDQCQHGLFCSGDGLCEEVVLVDEVGAACGGYENAPFCNLSLGLACAAELVADSVDYTVCVEMLAVGGSCMEMDPMTEVLTVLPCDVFAGLYCDMDFQNQTGVCVAKKAGGAQCDEDEACQSGYCEMNGTCYEEPTGPCE